MWSLSFWAPVLIFAGINAIVAIGVYVALMSGQLSVGHAAFMGIGGYSSGMLTAELGWPFLPATAVAVLIGAAVGALIAILTLRMNPLVVGLATLAFGESVVVLAINTEAIGGTGLTGMPNFVGLGTVFVTVIIVTVLVRRLEHSGIGLAARAVRDSPLAASCMGVNILRVRMSTFAMGTGIAALGGALDAHYTLFLHPSDMAFWVSIQFLIFAIFGGSYVVWGALIGALFLTMLPEVFRVAFDFADSASQSLRLIAYGVALTAVVILRPEGLIAVKPNMARRPGLHLPRRRGRESRHMPAQIDARSPTRHSQSSAHEGER